MSQVKVQDVIRRANTKVDKDNTDLLYYVGGEHIDSEKIRITRKGLIEGSTIGPMFYYGFKEGDFLLVSRNPHLKKAGVVNFSGICSEKTFVLETSDAAVLLPEYLPFVLQNQRFWNYAYEHRHGSTNTFINWATLANYEFELPDIESQRNLATVLWAINDTIDSYNKLILATDNLVKSQFLGQFSALPKEPLGNYIEQIRGVSYKPKDLKLMPENDTYELLRANNISSDGHVNFDEVQYVNKDRVVEKQLIRKGDILMCGSSGSLDHVGKAAICPPEAYGMTFGAFCKLIRTSDKLLPDFIAVYFMTDEYRNKIRQLACGSNINNLKSKHLDNLEIPVPSLNAQEDFVAFKEQSDKSKFELEQALNKLTSTYKRIIGEYLG